MDSAVMGGSFLQSAWSVSKGMQPYNKSQALLDLLCFTASKFLFMIKIEDIFSRELEVVLGRVSVVFAKLKLLFSSPVFILFFQ